MKKYLILGEPRSGTTRILRLVRDYYVNEHGLTNIFKNEALNLGLYKDFGDTYNERAENILADTENRFTVVKFLYDHFYNISDENKLKFFDAYEKIICTYRNNTYDQLLSYAIAKNLRENGVDRFNPTVHSEIPFDLQITRDNVFSIGNHFRNCMRIQNIIPRHKVIAVDYERSCDMSANELLSYIGISTDRKYKDATVKLDTFEEKWAKIINKDETDSYIKEYIKQAPHL
jgi:hypothetical protein